jgi:hypothetical protein
MEGSQVFRKRLVQHTDVANPPYSFSQGSWWYTGLKYFARSSAEKNNLNITRKMQDALPPLQLLLFTEAEESRFLETGSQGDLQETEFIRRDFISELATTTEYSIGSTLSFMHEH